MAKIAATNEPNRSGSAPDNVLTQLLAKVRPLARPLVMGVLNVTPDSFSDGGQYLQPPAAIEHARRLVAEGADIIDVGAEFDPPLWRHASGFARRRASAA